MAKMAAMIKGRTVLVSLLDPANFSHTAAKHIPI